VVLTRHYPDILSAWKARLSWKASTHDERNGCALGRDRKRGGRRASAVLEGRGPEARGLICRYRALTGGEICLDSKKKGGAEHGGGAPGGVQGGGTDSANNEKLAVKSLLPGKGERLNL